MKTFLTFLSLVLLMSCKSEIPQPKEPLLAMNTFHDMLIDYSNHPDHEKLYDTYVELQQLGDDTYEFIIHMDLHNGGFYVSPNAKRDFSGKFTLDFANFEHFEPISALDERPLSKEIYDPHPFVDGYVNWVNKDTKYHLKLKRTSDEEFHVGGYIQFTIEPKCTLEKIPIMIKYLEGTMHAEIVTGC